MKRYLTGIDWIINSIDYTGKAQSGIGNHSEVVLELKNTPHDKLLEEQLYNFIQKIPLLHGFTGRALNLCPYWKSPGNKKMLPFWVYTVNVDDDSQYLTPLAALVNAPFKNKREHLIFTLVNTGQRSFLGMVFDHRILDAKGAEAFLNLFQQYYQNRKMPEIASSNPHHLNRWKEKLLAGRAVNRFLIGLAKTTNRTLPFNLKNEPARFVTVHLNSQKARRFTDAAFTQAGYLMLMPYALAKTIQVMHGIFQEKNIPGDFYLIPVPMDTRTQEEAQKKVLFNHFSFFIFKISAAKADDLGYLLTEIKTQMYDQVKTKLPEAITNAGFLLRIVPLPLTDFFLRLLSKKHFASFSFSFLNNACQQSKLLEHKVENIFHLPRTPKPPGLGIYFNQFEDKLNITLSYFDGLLSGPQVKQITEGLSAIADEE
jgi:hypothetical protein